LFPFLIDYKQTQKQTQNLPDSGNSVFCVSLFESFKNRVQQIAFCSERCLGLPGRSRLKRTSPGTALLAASSVSAVISEPPQHGAKMDFSFKEVKGSLSFPTDQKTLQVTNKASPTALLGRHI